MESIIIAVISGLCVAIPSIIATILDNHKNNNIVTYQIKDLTEHVNKHNNLIDRMYKIENRVTLLEEGNKR